MSKRLINDWLTGNILLEEHQTAGESYIHNHAAGHTRVAEAAGEDPVQQWLLRGPQGQVRWVLENDLAVRQWFGYSSLGNRIAGQEFTPPSILPAYFDGDYSPVPSFPQFKDGGGTAQDMTQAVEQWSRGN